MKFFNKASRLWQRAVAGAVTVVAVAVVAACGGDTEQFEPFVAERVFAFGDDTSALQPDGRRHGTNGVDATTGAFDCNLEPMWVQVVASLYGAVFAECNTATPAAVPRAFMRAAVGAKVADIQGYYCVCTGPNPQWPFEDAAWKPSHDPVKNLVKAGALIAAEIDRLQRQKS